jgi:hypothetical protein
MVYFTGDAIGLSTRATKSAKPQYFITVLTSISALSVLGFLYHSSNSTIFNAVSNAGCIALIAYSASIVLRSQHTSAINLFYIVAACTFTLLSIVVNIPNASVTDGIKYLSIYVFYAAGQACAAKFRSVEVRYICFLAALPILFHLTIGNSRVPAFVEGNLSNSFSYFANVNVGTLYFSALIFALGERLGGRAILLQLLNAALMNKVGVAVATVVASTGFWILVPLRKGRKEAAIALPIFILVAMIAFWAGAFDRAIAILESMKPLVDLGPETISRMSFRELVILTGTTDLSGFFRVIHWADIWSVYSSGSLGTLLFGYGIGRTPDLTILHLVPHNDYLRILAEYGPLNLVVFVCFLLHVLFNLKTGFTRALFVVLLLYYFSENLIDHFASMAIYFTYAGRFSAMSGQDELRKGITRADERYWTGGCKTSAESQAGTDTAGRG